jgi:hypothetical protein
VENLDAEVVTNKARETIRENNIISAKESLGYYQLKRYRLIFDERCSTLLAQRKQVKSQWLQNRSEINWDGLNNIRCEALRHFRNKKKE